MQSKIKNYNINHLRFLGGIVIVSLSLISCTKLVHIDPPANSIATSQVFADSADALSAISGIYTNMINNNGIDFGNGAISIFCGSSADELLPFNSDGDQLSTNTLQSSNATVFSAFWVQPYFSIYQINAAIEGLNASKGISQTAKDEFTGEAFFLRAFVNSYLVNFFGDIPLLTTTDYKSNTLAFRAPAGQVYESIINDLKNAQNLLAADYSTSKGERIRANKWTSTALLARVYLYEKKWTGADSAASSVINSGLYSLDGNLTDVFLKNNAEAILQWQVSSTSNTSTLNATTEGYYLIPADNTQSPYYYISDQLLNGFETGDNRKIAWLDSTTYEGTVYYYPYKYKVGPAQTAANADVTEYYMVLRLAEQYLIRAEAEANLNDLAAAISDLNIIRTRAGLSDLPSSLNQTQVLAAVAQERRIELFAEWGHRWFDLKRTDQAHDILSNIPYKQPWAGDYQLLYPIPLDELQADPNLKQNLGY